MDILGVSAFYHDSAACLVRDGEIVAAAQEERFTRRKGDQAFPGNAIAYCLREGGLASARELDCVGFYERPELRFERILATFIRKAPRGGSAFADVMPGWLQEKLWLGPLIQRELGYDGPVFTIDHHLSHAASAFYPSPFADSAILTFDAVGEWATGTWGLGSGNRITLKQEMRYPHSLGMLYSAFTYYLGFKVNSGEYKVMGLAPYGRPRYTERIFDHLLDLREDGSFRLDMRYFDFEVGRVMTSQTFHDLFDGPPRDPASLVTQREMDLARSIQDVTNEIVLRMARHVRARTGSSRLCLAGGVALNCVANGLILREGVFDELWIQPAAGDAGGALGVALHLWFDRFENPRAGSERDRMRGALLGPAWDDDEIRELLDERGIPYRKLTCEELPHVVAGLLADGKVVGWFQGKMEFGPRALGARSILGDARRPEMQSVMNLKIKFRESFRPFAPSVLEEDASEYFELDGPSPYMLLITQVRESHVRPTTDEEECLEGIDLLKVARSDIPAVTHVDRSARVQTVSEADDPVFHRLIRCFKELTGCPVIINTSLNVRGEPICARPEEALREFLRTEMDYLALGTYLLDKRDQREIVGDFSDVEPD